MVGSPEDIGNALGEHAGLVIIVYIVLALVVATVLYFVVRRGREKSRELTKKELQEYITGMNKVMGTPRTRSGNVSIFNGNIYYSRGNRSIEVDAVIERNLILTPDCIAQWFEGRNYSAREEERILEDIKDYLIESGYCRSVTISYDEPEENDEFFSE